MSKQFYCQRCENAIEGAPTFTYNRRTEALDMWCLECAFKVVEEQRAKYEEHKKKLGEN